MANPPMQLLEDFDNIFYIHVARYFRLCGLIFSNSPRNIRIFRCVGLLFGCANCSSILYVLFTYPMLDTLKCIAESGVIVQNIVKWIMLAFRLDKYLDMVRFLKKIYQSNVTTTGRNRDILMQMNSKLLQFFRALQLLFLGQVVVALSHPIIMYMLFGKLVSVTQLPLPGIDEHTVRGNLAVCLYQFASMLMIIGCFGGSELLCLGIILNVLAIQRIFRGYIDDLNEYVVRTNGMNSFQLHIQLKNVVLMHQDICSFTKAVQETYYNIYTCNLYTTAVCLGACIYCIIKDQYVTAYIALVIYVSTLFYHCFLGTIFEICNDRIYDAITDIKWYYMPVSSQMHVLRMVHAAQHPFNLRAGVNTFNMTTFVSVMNSVYSSSMLLIETL